MEIDIIDFKNTQAVGKLDINESLVGMNYRPDILSLVVNWQLAKRRAGTHSSKGISDISGTTRKPYRQKGTGRARQGSLRSPQFRGGAVIFGPVVRKHEFKVNKKVRALGLKCALSLKYSDKSLFALEDCDLTQSKSAAFLEWFKNHTSFDRNKSLLIITSGSNETLKKSTSNLHKIEVLSDLGINVYSILKYDYLLIDKLAIKNLENKFCI
jgi:large subunit ribosomal protein L4